MKSRNIFENISPLDHRYSVSEEAVFDALSQWLSEDASVAACARAEAALVVAHLAVRDRITDELRRRIFDAAEAVRADDVYAEEEKTG